MCVWSAGHLARDAVVHELDLAAVGQQDVAPLHVAVEAEVLLQVEEGVQHLHNTQRQPVGAFNQEKALVGASSVIVEPMDRFTALYLRYGAEDETRQDQAVLCWTLLTL